MRDACINFYGTRTGKESMETGKDSEVDMWTKKGCVCVFHINDNNLQKEG